LPLVLWTLALSAFLGGWGLTLRFPGLLVWTLLWLAAYLMLAALQHGPSARAWPRSVRVRAIVAATLVVVTALGYALFPGVRIRGELVPTAILVDLLDLAAPVWIAAAAVPLLTQSAILRVVILVAVPVLVVAGLLRYMTAMPGHSYADPLPPLSEELVRVRDRLREHVRVLASEIGERNSTRYHALERAAEYIRSELKDIGYQAGEHRFDLAGQTFRNIEVELAGDERADEIVVVGAHYDTAERAPGANDNGSGVAALLELARAFYGSRPARTLRFVAFPNEEPPFFHTEDMGSWRYAARAKEREENIVAMLSLETLGAYSDEPGSQQYPPILGLLYPDRGNFIGFVGNLASRSLVHSAIRTFRASAAFPSEGVASPELVPGITWSDHLSFWVHGYRALMITDTAPFRYRHYHRPSDTPDKLDYEAMARVVAGLEMVVAELTGRGEP
jgi:Zn-dependent M28 family amino/carboxypeptidase